MSLKSWKREFYSTPAAQIKYGLPAIKHSIKKWRGLLCENLKKHELNQIKDNIGDNDLGPVFFFSSDTCALCQTSPDCEGCPILVTQGYKCDRTEYSDGVEGEYWKGIEDENPKPMIKLLERTERAWRKLSKRQRRRKV
jgi:hypothetical protein